MDKLCRYDFVIRAIEALNRYMDTCAVNTNTLSLVRSAHNAIHDLENIEKKLVADMSNLEVKQKKDVTSAIAELQGKIDSLEGLINKTEAFLLNHAEEFGQIKNIAKAVNRIEEINANIAKVADTAKKRVISLSNKLKG